MIRFNHLPATNRRKFIKDSVVAAGGITLGGAKIFGTNSSPHIGKRLGIALVGLGYYSSDLLAPALQQTRDCYLSGIVTGTPAKATSWQKKYKIAEPNIYNYKNFDKIATNEDIDVVYVVLPNDMHKEFTIRAARAGKHVICEKPMAMNPKECEEMIRVCEENGVGLSVGYRMRYTPLVSEIQRLSRKKVYGDIMMVNASAGFRQENDKGWRFKKKHGGGALMDMGVYALQAARYTIREEPIAVTAQSYTTRKNMFKEIAETESFQLEFPRGAIANVTGTFGFSVGEMYAQGTKGWIRQNNIWQYVENSAETSDGPIKVNLGNQQAAQMDHQCRAFRDDLPQWITGEEGLQDMKIIEAVHKSIELGGKRVEIV